MQHCGICGNTSGNKYFTVPEMMYGIGEEFDYMECSHCGCLQLTSPPSDFSKYYPSNYYSFSNQQSNLIQLWLDRLRFRYALNETGSFLGQLLVKKYGSPDFIEWIKRTGIKYEDAIIDIGCGKGNLLQKMANAGFRNLTGIDPYLEQDNLISNRVKLQKKEVFEVSNKYDLVMMHHSFEHMPDPLAVLRQVYRIVSNNCYTLINIPVLGYVWRKYGVNWVAIDAPRHLFLHTTKSMEILANQAGFEIVDIVYNSHAYQFWGSEQIARGIPVRGSLSCVENPQKSIFSSDDMKSFYNQSEELNWKKDGDSACFYLLKKE